MQLLSAGNKILSYQNKFGFLGSLISTLTTNNITSIAQTTATSGGNILSSGGAIVKVVQHIM
jgi:hypothetical protein